VSQHVDGRLPSDARIGDALPVDERLRVSVLTAFDEEALGHHPDDPALAFGDLRRDVAGDRLLAPVVPAAVPMREIDDEVSGQPS